MDVCEPMKMIEIHVMNIHAILLSILLILSVCCYGLSSLGVLNQLMLFEYGEVAQNADLYMHVHFFARSESYIIYCLYF